MASAGMEYLKMAANGLGAAFGGVASVVGFTQVPIGGTTAEKVGAGMVMAFFVAAEYKFIRDTVRNYRAARTAADSIPANDR